MKQFILSILLISGIAQAATEGVEEVRAGAGESGLAAAPLRAYPPIAIGHEAEYDRFLNGVLTYKPDRYSDEGRVGLRIRDLANPLDGTFDLSGFGDSSRWISIHTGYKKAKIPANIELLEIWLTPKFLVEANLGGDAAWMRGVMSGWEAPYGMVWTWGDYEVSSDNFDCLLKGEVLLNKDKNLYEKAVVADAKCMGGAALCLAGRHGSLLKNIFLDFD